MAKDELKKIARKKRLVWLLRAILFLVLMVGIWFDWSLWRVTNAATSYVLPSQADVILVLGCPATESLQPSFCQLDRTKAGVALWQEGYAPNLIVSGGETGRGIEARYMFDIAVQSGVPTSQLVAEERALNTVENLRYSQEIMKNRNWRNLILVSEPFHLYRARLQASDQNIAVAGWWPVTDGYGWKDGWKRTTSLIRDSLALMFYETLGRLIR